MLFIVFINVSLFHDVLQCIVIICNNYMIYGNTNHDNVVHHVALECRFLVNKKINVLEAHMLHLNQYKINFQRQQKPYLVPYTE